MEYFGLIVFIYVLIDMLVTKETGFLGSIVKKNEKPLSFYMYVAIVIFGIVLDLLYIFGII
ncbi:hypothetical protein [Fibrobacter sp. UWB3]|uniref:hypothetical protein n=1 Tax=Fibrobacter sp. UWB3 TaxID=1964357 RepID=UPI000B524611|nr:hypothetical protein [Fibrobacter sp. UWB3]OWV19462.1 hypothetical protein B7991_07355 [Fibrobacter sp. UWB3]